LNLVSLARNLPSLEEINISALMFASDEAQVKEIQSVKAEFPNLKVIRILV
jgi:preprotein translocase subunit Sec63